MKTYAITGATGNIGHGIAEVLLRHGQKVRAIARRRDKLAPLARQGAEVLVGTLADSDFLTRAFEGTAGVFAMIPPDLQAQDVRESQNRVGAAIAAAVRAAHVEHVVNLSSQGAHLPEGTGPIAGLHDQEERLNRLSGVQVVHLRAAFFMENTLNGLGMIETQGIYGTPLRGDLKFPAIATRDIARVAADYLLALDFSGQTVRDLLGPRDLSMLEITGILGRALGKPDVRYVQFPYEKARQTMVDMGLSPDVARVFVEMYQAINAGRILRAGWRTPESTTPTAFESFAEEIAQRYAQAA